MAGIFKGLTQAQIDRRLKEGRGQGRGSDYKPFIYTRDVSSLGRSHRLFGNKCRRLHHVTVHQPRLSQAGAGERLHIFQVCSFSLSILAAYAAGHNA